MVAEWKSSDMVSSLNTNKWMNLSIRWLKCHAHFELLIGCASVMFGFRKVTLLEDSDQNIHLKNLTVHQANTEEEALNLLFLGDTNRMIAEVKKT